MKILVVDDHMLVREGLALVLQDLDPPEIVEVLKASDCAQAFATVAAHRDLDLVLIDYHLPDMNGLAGLAMLSREYPEIPVVVLSGSTNPSIMHRALAQGAAGFITKSGQTDELLHTLRRVLNGESGVAIARDWGIPAAATDQAARAPVFTARQQEVLQLLLDGCSNQQIGQQLHLSEETIKNHVTAILRGFGVKSRMQAALEASRWGYTRSSIPKG